MKKIKCLDCDKEFSSDSKEEVLNQMMPHYKEDHAEMMASSNEESKKEWFAKFNKDWETAEEV